MVNWQYINNQNDIEEFIKATMGMHDSYMVGLDYMAGTWGDNVADGRNVILMKCLNALSAWKS